MPRNEHKATGRAARRVERHLRKVLNIPTARDGWFIAEDGDARFCGDHAPGRIAEGYVLAPATSHETEGASCVDCTEAVEIAGQLPLPDALTAPITDAARASARTRLCDCGTPIPATVAFCSEHCRHQSVLEDRANDMAAWS